MENDKFKDFVENMKPGISILGLENRHKNHDKIIRNIFKDIFDDNDKIEYINFEENGLSFIEQIVKELFYKTTKYQKNESTYKSIFIIDKINDNINMIREFIKDVYTQLNQYQIYIMLIDDINKIKSKEKEYPLPQLQNTQSATIPYLANYIAKIYYIEIGINGEMKDIKAIQYRIDLVKSIDTPIHEPLFYNYKEED